LSDLTQGEDKRLIFVASVAGLRGAAYAAPYVASKHGVIGLMKSLALEFAKSPLTVNAICPAFVDTPMTDESAERIARVTTRSETEAREVLARMNPNGRLVTADEVAASILFLCRPGSSSITGTALTVDGGATA
jgi:NAD(P)-dependent dehydrogenase (short-subunit alcohol dehydrogenase family)